MQKKWSEPTVFHTFDLEMCFAPQRRALFQHLNFQKWSKAGVLCTFWRGNVLRATTVCKLFIYHLARWLRTLRFWPDGSAPSALASLLFDPPKPQIIGKTQWIATKSAPASLSFSSLIFSLLFFSSLTLPTSAFPSVHIVGSLTSKLPSTRYYL